MDYSQLGKRRNLRKQNPHTTRIRNKIGLLALRMTLGAILLSGFAAFGAGFGLWFGILGYAPELQTDMVIPVYRSSEIICGHTNEVLFRLHAGHNHESVTIDQIPLHVQQAFLAIEDERFFEHNGVDVRGIGRAAHRLVSSGGEVTEGASTITQQLIKNMLQRFESNFVYKLQEQYLAVYFENFLEEQMGCRILAKEFILESYLNIINLGRQNYGVQSAALFYYDLNVWELSIAQAATIAAITQNPSRFPPDTRPEANWVRAQLVLENMLRLEFITEEEFYEAINSDVYSTIYRQDGGDTRPIISQFDCFTDALLTQVHQDLMTTHNLTADMATRRLFTGGLRIYTTQNPHIQAAVERVFLDDSYWPTADFTIDVEFNFSIHNAITDHTRHMQRRTTVNNMAEADAWIAETLNRYMTAQDVLVREQPLFTPQPQAAFVILDHHNGHVLAMRGVRGERGTNRSFNRATQATRQPGSQLKTIGVFGPAFDMGIYQPASIIIDEPFTYICPWGGAPWTPRNWDRRYNGPTTPRRAVYHSMNIVSARATVDHTIPHVGVDAMFSYLRNMGISTIVDGQDGPAVALGGMNRGVHLIELAGAYGAVANLGMFNAPVLYTLVLGPEGEVVLENPYNPTRVMRDTAAYLLIDTMRDTMRRGTGGQINWANNQEMRNNIPIAGKTGTTNENRDLGFSGSTPYFTAAIWLGNDSNARMTTRGAHLVAWRSIMQEIHEGLPARAFPRPTEGRIVTATVCSFTGLVPTASCGGRRTDIFDYRFVPTQTCETCNHVTHMYCTISGYLAGDYCPPEHVATRTSTATPWDGEEGFPDGVLAGRTCPIHLPPPQEEIPWQPPSSWTPWIPPEDSEDDIFDPNFIPPLPPPLP